MYRLFFITFFSLFSSIFLFAQDKNIEQSVNKFVGSYIFKHASIGIHALDLETGEVLATYQGDKSLATASVMKLLSTATVLENKGAGFRYKTPIAYLGNINEGILQGNLVIKGVGDPTFNSKYFPDNDVLEKIVTILKKNNIKEISRDLLLDCSEFDAVVPNSWLWEDIANYYGATLHPINYKDNTYDIVFATKQVGSIAKIISINPKQHLKIKSKVVSSEINEDRAYIFGASFGEERLVRGTLPKFRKSFTVKGSMANPPLVLGEELSRKLSNSGIKFYGKIEVRTTPVQKVKVLDFITSPSLAEIISVTNHESVNLFAEAMIFLMKEKSQTHIEREDLTKQLIGYWNKKGIDTEGISLYDGSGLSVFNKANPSFFTSLLFYMATSPNNQYFKESLPISGINGTLKRFGKGTSLEGRIYAKSGSMKQVCNYSGYLTSKSGRTIVFAVMVNNFSVPTSKVRNEILQMLTEW